jgi:hypothetical protein
MMGARPVSLGRRTKQIQTQGAFTVDDYQHFSELGQEVASKYVNKSQGVKHPRFISVVLGISLRILHYIHQSS